MGGQVSRVYIETIAKNLARPQNTVSGHILGKLLKRRNALQEHTAVRLCNIQPHYQVLEVGFGPGVGLRAAHDFVKDGSGVIHGVDISDKMMQVVSQDLKNEISAGKVVLYPNSVTELPFKDNTIDCIFHCNCYYFWPDMEAATKELYRVIKHDGVMVAVRNPESLKNSTQKGFLKYGNTDVKRYMESLERSGFNAVKISEHVDEKTGIMLETIIGTACKT